MRLFHSSAYSTYLFILQWRYLMVAWFISDLDGTNVPSYRRSCAFDYVNLLKLGMSHMIT